MGGREYHVKVPIVGHAVITVMANSAHGAWECALGDTASGQRVSEEVMSFEIDVEAVRAQQPSVVRADQVEAVLRR